MSECPSRKGVHEWLNTAAVVVFGILGAIHACGQDARLESLEEQALVERLEQWRSIVSDDPARVLRESAAYLDEPVDSRVLFLRGRAHQEAGDAEGAIAELRESIRRDPGSFEAHAALGAAHLRRNETEPAITALESALELSRPPGSGAPSSARRGVLVDLASAYVDRGRTREARDLLAEALAMDRTDAAAHLVLGRAYRAESDFPAALEAFARVRELGADELVAIREIASTRYLGGDFAAAARTLEELRERRPESRHDAVLNGLLLSAYEKAGEAARAAELREEMRQATAG